MSFRATLSSRARRAKRAQSRDLGPARWSQIPRLLRFAQSLGMTIVLVLTVASCELATVNVPATDTMIELQGVLNVGASAQLVLLERVHTGLVNAHDTLRFNAADPIASDDGIPVSGAAVDL